MDGIPDHLYALLQSGSRNYGGIREEQQLIIRRNLHYSQMSQDFTLRQQTFSLSRIACNKLSVLIMPFIKISAPPSRTIRTASRAASSGSSICTVRTYWGYFFNVGYFQESQSRQPSGTPQSLLPENGQCIFRIGVISTNYCNTFPFVQGFQVRG